MTDYGRAEIQVLDEAWNVVETIGNEEARPLVYDEDFQERFIVKADDLFLCRLSGRKFDYPNSR